MKNVTISQPFQLAKLSGELTLVNFLFVKFNSISHHYRRSWVSELEEITLNLGEISKFMWRYSLGRDSGMESLHFLRIKIPAGRIKVEELFEIAEISKEYGRGYAEITDRQDIQLHWIDSNRALEIFEKLYRLGYTTDLCGQAFSSACHGDVRNIAVCPLSGKINDFDVAEHAIKLTEFFSGNPDFIDLPKKFKIAFTACGTDCVRAGINDLGMIGVERDGERGFTPLIGGGIGATYPGPSLGKHMPVFVPEERVFEFVKAVVEIHRDYSSRESKAKARFKHLVASWGVEKIRETVEDKIGELEDFEGLPPLKFSAHKSSGKQINGLHYLTLPLIGGILDAEKLEKIAELSEKYGSGEIRLTTTQNVIFVDVEDLNALKSELERHFKIYDGDAFYNSIGCASNFCGKTKDVHAKDMLRRLLEVAGELGVENEVLIYVSGCHNACGCHHVAPFGLAGKLIRRDGEIIQGYDFYIGGDIAKLKMGKLYRESLTSDEVVEVFREIVMRYKSSGKSLKEFLEGL